MANPYATSTNTVDGVWIVPYGRGSTGRLTSGGVYIRASELQTNVPISSGVFEIRNRFSKVVETDYAHGHEGTVRGLLMDINGLTASQWAWRLRLLIQAQMQYRLRLVSPVLSLGEIRVVDGHSISPRVMPNTAKLYDVEIPFVQILALSGGTSGTWFGGTGGGA